MSLRTIVLSDLHLGADDSLLTHREGSHVVEEPGAVLARFGEAIRATARGLGGGKPVQLVLMGDALDLGLSPFGDVSRSFVQFLKCMFPHGEEPVFDPGIVYVPGNHDHHIWRMVQDHMFVSQVQSSEQHPGVHVPDDIAHISPMTEAPQYECRLLTALMHGYGGAVGKAQVKVAYPNWSLVSEDGEAAVVMHHGHYLDASYRLLSQMQGWLHGKDGRPETTLDVERQNGSWVDFLWSDLGSSGEVGEGANTLYATMLDAGASHQLGEKIASRIAEELHRRMGVYTDAPLKYGITPGNLIRAGVVLAAGREAEVQRDGFRQAMGADEVEDLRWYLTGPVRDQFESELGKVPRDVRFIFGHTHKPFQDQIPIEGYERPVGVFNTGGWVLDEPKLMPAQGASAILIDDSLEAVALRLFNDPAGVAMPEVRIGAGGGYGAAQDRFVAEARAAVANHSELWGAFTAEVKSRIDELSDARIERFLDTDETLQEAAE